MEQYTPMIQQYLAIKNEYPDAFLFFRLGDFYEMFFDDAIKASRELEITLTGRDGGGTERIPMCGVPHHSADQYIAELVKKGYKVAICEQVEDPKTAKGVVRREVTRVITPGTMMEDKFLAAKENNYLVAIAEAAGRQGVAAADVSTGELFVTSLPAGGEAGLEEALQYRPSELILCGALPASYASGRPVAQIAEEEVDHGAARQQFAAQAAELDEAMLLAVNALLLYITRTQKRNLSHLRRLSRYEAKQFLQMDPFSRRNLELTETIRDKQKKGSLLWLLDRTQTAMGGRLLRRWIERPLLDLAQINQRLTVVEQLKQDLLLRTEIREALHRVYDLERLAGRIAYGSANGRDLLQLRHSLEAIPLLKERLRTSGQPDLSRLSEGMDECSDLVDLLARALVDDPPVSVREGGLIRSGYDAYLDKLREASREGKNWIAQLEQAEREATGIRSLKVGFNKVFGYYLEVSRPNLASVPEGRYIRKQTLANAERFVTPELKEKEALILEAEEKMVELEYQLFVQIRSEIASHIPRLQALAEQVAAVDVLQSFATVSDERRYVRPQFSDQGELVIRDGRHPVVEAVLDKESYVANDAELNQETRQILLITGPNMAGKSTYMRQIALIAIMAQIGCFVPASYARLSLVDQIFTRIGAADDLVGGHSTFMVEMLETKNALAKATSRSLILLDEIGRGTSTYDGMALAQAVIEYIHERIGAKTLFSTHYHELTALEDSLPRLVNVNARCEERDGKLLFLHKIVQGRADKSYGIHVAQLAGLPHEVIERARQILAQLEEKRDPLQVEQIRFELFPETAAADGEAEASAQKKKTAGRKERAERPAHPAEPLVPAAERDVLRELLHIDLDRMTPLEALVKLSDWKQRLKK
ncbi:DNA mismatch repair protein MutS [Brevibacillus marinus]|uniref:DNA mismatch repair protein MutS n=1 Tax=Brevibacillus marinus TaxID=2496837 RepID=UPI000F81DC65|nr:DNA mismatch repair protein MutS [Brevibacillus marinus]